MTFEAPFEKRTWDLKRGDTRVAGGHLMAHNKVEIVAELGRQVNYFLENVAI